MPVTPRARPIAHPWIDSSRAPLYVVRMPSPMSSSDLLGFARAREQWSETVRSPVAFVVDISRLTTADGMGQNRALFAGHLRRFEAFEKRYTAAVGIVADSAITRGIVKAVFWLQQPAFAYTVVTTVEDAVVFTSARLRNAAPT
jgi:hypothetical protein